MRDRLSLQGRHILLGISGGIACYRSAELVRLLRASGATVRCVMTRSACEFVTPLTFESLSGEEVFTELFSLHEHTMGHITLARWADLLLIAPATAQLLSKLAHGVADDLLSTLALACSVPMIVAPAMNPTMWQAPPPRQNATQRNVTTLRANGVVIAEPDTGDLACGEVGTGRMRQPPQLLDDVRRLLAKAPLAGQRWVITTGPTWESWDDVRLLTSRASGRLGAEIARIVSLLGAETVVIAGPGVPDIAEVQRINVESAKEMERAALAHAAGADCFVSAAAVADYRPSAAINGKLKRAEMERCSLPLTQNPDIVAKVAAMAARPRQVIAFAAEDLTTGESHAFTEGWRKLQAKGVDGLVLNSIRNMQQSRAGGWWLQPGAEPQPLMECEKSVLAAVIVERIVTA
ncbi:MAG: bifunctional phosphopantothenoylcysteine decarboxylase/phosphopantothenate--cysteine ligase CoaBC [Mariprofundales bacterium]|nr:bifunctional phosphopantothenoylcysteine decarboxylase/phosphopantothenate--cysteine ligase CoaBC [Mariprofundales bacterium]